MSQTANTIRHFDGFNPTLEKPRDMLPVGGYICKIIKAKAENRVDGFQELDIMVEITEGPYAGFFRKDYDAQNRAFTPRYRGIYRIICPTDNMQPGGAWRLDKFNTTLGAIADGNPGYVWNWDASSLIGLTVGISVRENEYQGSIYTEIGKLIPVAFIRNGTFRPMRRRISREDGNSNIMHGYTSPFAGSQQTPAPDPTVMVPRAGGYSLPQSQGVQAVQQNMSGSSSEGSPEPNTEDDDIPF